MAAHLSSHVSSVVRTQLMDGCRTSTRSAHIYRITDSKSQAGHQNMKNLHPPSYPVPWPWHCNATKPGNVQRAQLVPRARRATTNHGTRNTRTHSRHAGYLPVEETLVQIASGPVIPRTARRRAAVSRARPPAPLFNRLRRRRPHRLLRHPLSAHEAVAVLGLVWRGLPRHARRPLFGRGTLGGPPVKVGHCAAQHAQLTLDSVRLLVLALVAPATEGVVA